MVAFKLLEARAFGDALAQESLDLPRGDVQAIIEARFPSLAAQEAALEAYDERARAVAATLDAQERA